MSEVSQDTFRRINCVICGLDLPLGDAQDTYGKHLREKHGLCHECSIGESEFCQERCKERGLFESRPTEATDANINERNPWPKPWRVRWQRGWEYDYEMRYDYYDTKEQAEANRPLAPHWIEHEPDVKKQKTKATDAEIQPREGEAQSSGRPNWIKNAIEKQERDSIGFAQQLVEKYGYVVVKKAEQPKGSSYDRCGYVGPPDAVGTRANMPCRIPRKDHLEAGEEAAGGYVFDHAFVEQPKDAPDSTKATDADIVERIRLRQDSPGRLADEAADTIERLEAAQSHSVDITIPITIDGGTK